MSKITVETEWLTDTLAGYLNDTSAWRDKAVKLEGELIINGLHLCLLYRIGEGFPHKAVRKFLEKYGIE